MIRQSNEFQKVSNKVRCLFKVATNSQIDETKVKKMKATEIKNYQNLTAKDIVSYMKNNNISTITSGKIEYSVDDIEDSWEYILEKEKVLSKIKLCQN